MTASRGMELRVGLFVFIAIAIGSALVFVIGSQKNLFVSTTEYRAVFGDVGGLRGGSPVRIAGVSVGTVSSIDIGSEGKIHVRFGVRDDAKHLLREGSVASVASKGMLGDQLLEVTVGTGKPLPAGATVPTSETAALSKYVKQAGRVLTAAEVTAHNIRAATEALGDPQFGADIRNATRDLARILNMIAEGRGPLYRLVNDKKMANSLARTAGNLETASEQLASTLGDAKALTRQVRKGDGLAHDLLYGEEGKKMLRDLANASSQLAAIIADIRTNDSTVHRLLYSDDAKELLANLTAMSANLKQVAQEVRAGRGTLGGLVSDPSLYEDLKRLVGDLRRNEILRALVRYSIKQDEARSTPQASTGP